MHLQYKLNKPLNDVFMCLSVADNFVKVHPIIYAMKPLPNGDYLAHEKLKIAFLNIDFTYPCTIESNKNDKTIAMKAVVKKMVHIKIEFKLSTQNDKTLVNEFISKGYFSNIGVYLCGQIRNRPTFFLHCTEQPTQVIHFIIFVAPISF